ncbi:hypothetical protein B0J11DRAFT_142587 [Dendryphion nanum]|uniref:Uncharacterized protein n=1 Tax=Dendryphion nanum TaxID=256645 RepID=A0A9P9D6Z3_9PLEO|nr:hypothetical protein B0J11DRAFT_142587 [Dendryphion nanum]
MKLIRNALEEMQVIGQDIGYDASHKIAESQNHWNPGNHWAGFIDLFCAWTDWIPVPGSPITKVFSPVMTEIYTMGAVWEARVAWRWILQQRHDKGDISKTMERVLEHFNDWKKRYEWGFVNPIKLFQNRIEDMGAVEYGKAIYDETTRCFEAMALKYRNVNVGGTESASSFSPTSKKPLSFYANLVSSHVKINASSLKEADVRIQAGTHRNDERVGMKL